MLLSHVFVDFNIYHISCLDCTQSLVVKVFEEQRSLCQMLLICTLYFRVRNNIPWDATPASPPTIVQWIAHKDEVGFIRRIYHITNIETMQTTLYINDITERLHCVEQHHPYVDNRLQELHIVQCGGPQKIIINFNPKEALDPEHTL